MVPVSWCSPCTVAAAGLAPRCLRHGGVEIEAGDHLVDVVELAHCQAGEQVRNAGARSHADHGRDPGVARRCVHRQHCLGRLPVVVDIEIVDARRDGGAQDGRAEAEEGADGVEHGAGAAEQARQRAFVAHVDFVTARLVAERRREGGGRRAVEIGHHELLDEIETRRGGRGVATHATAAEDDDLHDDLPFIVASSAPARRAADRGRRPAPGRAL